MIILVLFVFIHLNIFAQKADCAPDTHVHIYVPPEQEGAAQNTGFENFNNPAPLGMDYGGKPSQKTKSESESGTTEVPRSTAANKRPRNDGNEEQGMVNCGRHTASRCGRCPYNGDVNMGAQWCNGDCEWRVGAIADILNCYKKAPGWTMVNCGAHVAVNCAICPGAAPEPSLRPAYCNGECKWNPGIDGTGGTCDLDQDLAQWQEWNNWSQCSDCKPGQPGLKVRARRCGCDFDQAWKQSCKRANPCGPGCVVEVTDCDDEECTGARPAILDEAEAEICRVDKSSISLI